MKHAVTLSALATALLTSVAMAQSPTIIRGALPSDLSALLKPASPVKVATCPAGFNEKFANQKLACERNVTQRDDVKCPAAFPNFTARNVSVGSDRDLCAKAGVNISSDGALTNFRNGTDFVFIPADGVRAGVSFLLHHPNAVDSDGWTVNSSNSGASGITDRYQRTLVIKATPILVNP